MLYEPKDATPATAAANHESAARYDMADRRDFADARRCPVASIPDGKTVKNDGTVVFDLAGYGYLTDDAPAPETVNPSLWRQSQVIHEGGLYRVTEGIYQVRNSDIGNLTIVEGEDGLIIIDTMSGIEPARQGLDLFREHVADKPVVAVIYTHTHIDHYGGVKGVVNPADVTSGKCRSSHPARSRRSTSTPSARTSSPETRCRAAPCTPSATCSTSARNR
jgi:alkyl sulfatase BDS1-like metallo-beta-lactamase superfamily hydrolase